MRHLFKMSTLPFKIISVGLSLTFLAACEGGELSKSVVLASDSTPPTLSFTPSALRVESGGTASSVLSAVDNVGIVEGPSVACTERGVFEGSIFQAPVVENETISLCTATATDAAGNVGTTLLMVTIEPPNAPPIAEATVDKAIIASGQPFAFDASASTDPEGSTLSFKWTQISGPAVNIETPNTPRQILDAPDVGADESLVFEVAVSDGETESLQTVSVDVEALDRLSITGKAPPNTTNTFYAQIAGITSPFLGGFNVHWTTNGLAQNIRTATQSFTDAFDRVGPETTRLIQASDNVVGARVSVIQSDSKTYAVNQIITTAADNMRRSGFTFSEESPNVETVGTLIADGDLNQIYPTEIAGAAYADERLVTALMFATRRGATYIDGFILSPDGSQIRTRVADLNDQDIGGVAISAAGPTAYIVAWSRGRSDDLISTIRARRVPADGTQMDSVITISNAVGYASSPVATPLSDGRVLIVWADGTDFAVNRQRRVLGRILRSNGSLATDVFTVYESPADATRLGKIEAAALPDGGALIAWTREYEEAQDGQTKRLQIQAQAIGSFGAPISNLFNIFDEARDPNLIVSRDFDDFKLAISTDIRALIGWNFRENSVEKSYYAHFYPIGK
jgi:hypothetical protein